jgi:hypothetical protein
MKLCKKCDTHKPETEFSPCNKSKDGLEYRCKKCNAARVAKYHASNRETVNEKMRERAKRDSVKRKNYIIEYRRKNADRLKAYAADYRKNNNDAEKERRTKWRMENPEKAIAATLSWQERNKERIKETRKKKRDADPVAWAMRLKKYREKGKSRYVESMAKWSRENRHIKARLSNEYRARKMSAIPSWADKYKINQIYEQAESMRLETGDKYEVDHIIPLKSDIVCGLHCEFNLQILPHKKNSAKGNRYWPDMPEAYGAILGVMFTVKGER